MKKILIILSVLLALLLAGLVVLPSLVPSSVYKENIEQTLSRELVRDVRVLGDVKLRVFPLIKAETGRVEIANPEGFTETDFAAMDGLSARVKLWPLLSKRVEIAAFTLLNPEINLEKMADGRANWVFGEPDVTPAPTADGPFKRDGRYSDINPAIGQFSLKNGTISYVDRKANISHVASDVNVDFSLPSLATPLAIKGDFVYGAVPTRLDMTLDSIRAFLDGQAAPFTLKMETDFAEIDSAGQFLAEEAIAFTTSLSGDVSDLQKLLSLVSEGVDMGDSVSAVKFAGDYTFKDGILRATNADVVAKGAALNASFTGDAIMVDPPTFSGQIKAESVDVQGLLAAIPAKMIPADMKGLDLPKSGRVSATLTTKDDGFSASAIDAQVTGEGFTVSYAGMADIGETVTATGELTTRLESVSNMLDAFDIDMAPSAAFGRVDVKGQLSYASEAIRLSDAAIRAENGAVNGTFLGHIALTGETPSAKGTFDVAVPDVPNAARLAALDIPQTGAIGAFSTTGQLAMTGDTITLIGLAANAEGGTVQGRYTGDATLGEVPAFDGAFDGTIPQLSALTQAAVMDVPYASSIGRIKISGKVVGVGKAIKLSGVDATLSEGQVNGQYTGDVKFNDGVSLGGRLNADIPSLRALAKTTGTDLPASMQAGEIFGPFAVAGNVSGTPNALTFSEAKLTLDKLSGTGTFGVDLTPVKPFVTGKLDMAGLDLRPYVAAYSAQKPTGEIQPWSEAPLNLDFLKSVDGDFTLTSPNIILDRLSLGASTASAKLREGVLTADVPNLSLYGGLGRMTAKVSAASAVPTVSLQAGLDDLNSNQFLAAVAGFTQATGEGATSLKITGQGRSQAEIMKSLSGGGDFKLVNGQISGVDLPALLTGLDQALTSRKLPSGIGADYVTKFNDIIGLFTIENGVAKIGQFSLAGFGVLADGQGEIDLGGQNIDFSLHPRLTGKNASDLAALGIPVKFTGSFGNVSIGPDTDMLGQIVAQRAQAEAQKLIQEQVGGQVGGISGDILGIVLGDSKSGSPAQISEGETPKSDTDIITGLIGGVLGGATQEAPPETRPQTGSETVKPQTSEEGPEGAPSLEDALGALFGKPKETADTPPDE